MSGIGLHLTPQTVFANLSRIAHNDPHRYGTRDGSSENGLGTGCSYFDRDENGVLRAVCIIGQFFADLGLLGLMVHDWHPAYASPHDPLPEADVCDNTSRFFDTLAEVGVTIDPLGQRLMILAQMAQDNRGNLWESGTGPRPWGEAWELVLDTLRKEEESRLDEATTRLVLDSEVFNLIGRSGTTAEIAEQELDPWERDLFGMGEEPPF